jgi:vacuolar-type H+-ATPase subunit I/STV1
MTDAESPAAPIADAGETYSKDYVESLKKELAAKSEAEAVLKAKFAAHDERQRAQLAELQPVVSEWIKEGMEAAPEHKHEMQALQTFGDNLAKAESVESAMPFARMISVHSAKFKRERETFSQVSATAEELGKANKQIEELTADRDAKVSRIAELEGLCTERQEAAEKMQAELARAGMLKEKLDFSKATSREKSPPDPTQTSESARAPPAAPAAPAADPLLAFVQRGSGTGRIGLSSTGHHLLGASAGGDTSLATALRMA